MKRFFLIPPFLAMTFFSHAQLYIAPGDSISVVPGTLFTLQEDLENNGKIYNNGVLTLNGTVTQNLSGTGGSIDNLTADNNAALLSDVTVNNALLVNAGKIVDIGSSQLTSNGNINGAGFLKGSLTAQLLLNGTGSSVIQTDQSNDAVSNAFRNITVSGSTAIINFQNKLYLYEALLPDAGTINLNDEFILRSGNAATARVGEVGSAITYAAGGKFVVERYIPGNRAWRLLTAPVTTASLVKISEAWQDNAPRVTNVNDINGTNNPRPGFGTHITFGMPATNGYDQGINGNTSIRYLMNTGWNGVPTATNDGSILNSGYINDQAGYMLFVRGDRSTLLWQATAAVTTPTVLRPKGKIKTGLISHPLTAGFNNGLGSIFRVIGNPYPSPINFHTIATNPVNVANGFADAFYLWDPNITGTNGVGGFVGMSYNAAASIAAGHPVYDRTVLTGGGSSIDNSGDIQSGAAFVIDYSGAATSLRIEETNKSAGSNNSFFRPAGQVRTSLFAVNADSTVSLNDGALISIEENRDHAGNNDLLKLSNFAENISIRENGRQVSIQRRAPLTAGDTIFFHTAKLKQKNYILELEFHKTIMPTGTAGFLEDLYLQSKSPVSLNGVTSYPFSVSGAVTAADTARFRLLFKKINQFVSVIAEAQGDEILVNWVVADTFRVHHYEIERSTDGLHFSSIANTGSNEWLDTKMLPGKYFYRVKCINGQGIISYSNIAAVTLLSDTRNIFVFPNPVNGGKINLHIGEEVAGWYKVRILDNGGKIVHTTGFYHDGGKSAKIVTIDGNLTNGMYHLELQGPSKKKSTIKIVVQKQ